MPRLCDESAKLLCVKRDCQCDFGTKDKLCGFSGEDPNQCILQEGKVLCCVSAQDCYCEVSRPTTICASVVSSLSLCVCMCVCVHVCVCACVCVMMMMSFICSCRTK